MGAVCPACGATTGALVLVVGLVRIETHKCKCGRVWRVINLVGQFFVHDSVTEVTRLQKRYPGDKPPHVKLALNFLQTKIDDHARSSMDRDSALRKRRLDVWERRFLQEAMEDSYS